MGSPVAARPKCHSPQAEANVACPHRSTSTLGVSQRNSNTRWRWTRKAVSDKFISAATACNQPSAGQASSKQTAAGLPEKGRSANASTTRSGIEDGPVMAKYRGWESIAWE